MMLRKIRTEDAASLVERAIAHGLDERAEAVHFELKQHYLLIRLRWGTRMRMLWRGTRVEVPGVLEYLKAAAGMDVSVCRVPQGGEFTLLSRGQVIGLPAVCKPYCSEEKVVLSLPAQAREAEPLPV